MSADAGALSVNAPTDKPVDAIDNAVARRRWNHRVTSVVAGIRPD